MHRIVQVLDEHLPVAIVHVPEHSAGHFETSHRGAVGHVVHGGQGLAEVVLEAQAGGAEAREHEAPVLRDVRHGRHAARRGRFIEPAAGVAFAQGDGAHAAVEPVGPSVIRAAQDAAGTGPLRGRQQFRALVGTAVHQHAHLAVAPAHHDHGLTTHVRRVVIAGIRNLARMPDVDPGAVPQPLHLQVEHLGIAVHVAVHGIRPHERGDSRWVVAIPVHQDTPEETLTTPAACNDTRTTAPRRPWIKRRPAPGASCPGADRTPRPTRPPRRHGASPRRGTISERRSAATHRRRRRTPAP